VGVVAKGRGQEESVQNSRDLTTSDEGMIARTMNPREGEGTLGYLVFVNKERRGTTQLEEWQIRLMASDPGEQSVRIKAPGLGGFLGKKR